MPRIIILAGPNGAGKTTFAKEFLPNEANCIQFVNADLIAAGLSPFDPASADVAAGRLMLLRLDELASAGVDFALETTLSGMWLLRKVKEWRLLGYQVELFYLKLSDPTTSIARITTRVGQGGHHVPDETVRRRFARSLTLLNNYKEVVSVWTVYNNNGSEPILEETGRN